MLATNIYFARTFGGLRRAREQRTGLAPWQMRRIVEMIASLCERDVTLVELAAECQSTPSPSIRASDQQATCRIAGSSDSASSAPSN